MESETDPTKPSRRSDQTSTQNNSESPQIIDETPIFQMPKSPTDEHKSTIETPTTNETTPTQDVPHPTMEITPDDFPSLPTQKQENHATAKPVPKDGGFSDGSKYQSPAVILEQPIQTTFKIPRENTSDSEEPTSTLTTLTREQRNTIACQELHKYTNIVSGASINCKA